jgi:hypothetical protein
LTYNTTNGVSTDLAAEYSRIEVDASNEVELDAILRDSERYVKYYAPAPDPVTADYTSAAADGEKRIFKYLASTEGIYTGSGIGGVNESFIDFEKVESLIKSTVGLYDDTDNAGGGANVAYIERFR